MEVLLNVSAPFFALIFGGYAAAHFGAIGGPAIAGLNSFVFWFALPALLFMKMSAAPLANLLDWRFAAAYSGGGLLSFALTLAAGRMLFAARLGVGAIQGMAGAFGNIGLLGLPLILAVFGSDAVAVAAVVLVLDHVLLLPLTAGLIELGRSSQASLLGVMGRVFGGLARHPLILATIAGLAYGGLGVPLPVPAAAFGDLLASAASPCALFALGATLVGRPLAERWPEVAVMSTAKLIVHPCLVWLLASALALDPSLARVVVVQAAMPIAANVFIMARAYDIYVERASSAILVSTLIAVVTVSALLAALAPR